MSDFLDYLDAKLAEAAQELSTRMTQDLYRHGQGRGRVLRHEGACPTCGLPVSVWVSKDYRQLCACSVCEILKRTWQDAVPCDCETWD